MPSISVTWTADVMKSPPIRSARITGALNGGVSGWRSTWNERTRASCTWFREAGGFGRGEQERPGSPAEPETGVPGGDEGAEGGGNLEKLRRASFAGETRAGQRDREPGTEEQAVELLWNAVQVNAWHVEQKRTE